MYGGGSLTAVTPQGGGAKHFGFAAPRIGGRTEFAGCIKGIDRGEHYRYVIPSTMQMEGGSKELAKIEESMLPLRLAVQGGDDIDTGYVLTDNPAFQPPTLTFLIVTPSTGPTTGGTAVTITEADLGSITVVNFDSTVGTELILKHDTELSVISQAGISGAKFRGPMPVMRPSAPGRFPGPAPWEARSGRTGTLWRSQIRMILRVRTAIGW